MEMYFIYFIFVSVWTTLTTAPCHYTSGIFLVVT